MPLFTNNHKLPGLRELADQLPDDMRVLAKRAINPVAARLDRYITQHDLTIATLRSAEMIGMTDWPVLICGPSGTGKELLAKAMLGSRPDDQFFPVNCAGIVDTLFESLLFGHTAGAFTGAARDQKGLLVRAGTGVVFFDEVGDLPLAQQAKLLRAIQEKRVLPVGSPCEIPICCRFVFATNRNLPAMVGNYIGQQPGPQFREDLFFRISALTLDTYPLSKRGIDADLIARAISQANDWDWPEGTVLPQDVVDSPGNVRAVENYLIRRQVLGID